MWDDEGLFGVCVNEKDEKQNRKLMKQYMKLTQYHEHMLTVFQSVFEIRQIESPLHLKRIEAYSRILATHYAQIYPRAKMTKKKINLIAEAARMHDIGKIIMPDALIRKSGKLSSQELEGLMEHTQRGSEIMELIAQFRDDDYGRIGYNICKYHHAKYDGSGYPYGVKGDEIPIEAQIVAVADMYDVLLHEPINRHAYSKDEAFHIILNGKCGELAPRMKECLVSARRELENVKVSG